MRNAELCKDDHLAVIRYLGADYLLEIKRKTQTKIVVTVPSGISGLPTRDVNFSIKTGREVGSSFYDLYFGCFGSELEAKDKAKYKQASRNAKEKAVLCFPFKDLKDEQINLLFNLLKHMAVENAK